MILKGVRIFLTVPSIDTSVCDMEVKKFNEEVAKVKWSNLPHNIQWICPLHKAGGVEIQVLKGVITYQIINTEALREATGSYVKELGLLARNSFDK